MTKPIPKPESMTKKPKICAATKCKVELTNRRDKYCSPACAVKAKKERDKKKKLLKRRGLTIDKLDKLWGKLVKVGGVCEHCGVMAKKLDPHHIFSRSNLNTRWDLDNGCCLCSGCHTLSSSFSAHKTPLEFVDWLYKTKGEAFIDNLRKKARIKPIKTKEDWYEYLNTER